MRNKQFLVNFILSSFLCIYCLIVNKNYYYFHYNTIHHLIYLFSHDIIHIKRFKRLQVIILQFNYYVYFNNSFNVLILLNYQCYYSKGFYLCGLSLHTVLTFFTIIQKWLHENNVIRFNNNFICYIFLKDTVHH